MILIMGIRINGIWMKWFRTAGRPEITGLWIPKIPAGSGSFSVRRSGRSGFVHRMMDRAFGIDSADLKEKEFKRLKESCDSVRQGDPGPCPDRSHAPGRPEYRCHLRLHQPCRGQTDLIKYKSFQKRKKHLRVLLPFSFSVTGPFRILTGFYSDRTMVSGPFCRASFHLSVPSVLARGV